MTWQKVGTVKITALALTLLIGWGRPIQAQAPDEALDVAAVLAAEGSARVIVALQVSPDGVKVGLQPGGLAQAQASVLAGLAADDFKLLHRYETVPGLAGQVTARGLEKLLDRPEVAAVALDRPVAAALAESVALIGADVVVDELGFRGAGVNVAILDTGIDLAHPDLAGHIVAQKCFNRATCPPDDTNEGDDALDEHGHGTHVAGIVGGQGQSGPPGVAPGAGLVMVRVLGPSGGGFTSDVLSGLDWVVTHQAQLEVKVINLSLGGGAYPGDCDSADANTQLYAEVVRQANQAGITVFAASGNSGLTDQMMSPACISGVIAVGGTYDADLGSFTFGGICTDEEARVDQITCASNSSAALDLLAPAASIVSAAPGGGQRTRAGTSMSTAHASGAAALMLEAGPDLSPPEIKSIMQETGRPVTDSRNDRITPRLDALAAVTRVTGSRTITLTGTVRLQGRTDHSGTAIFLSQEPCSTAAFGPAAATTGPDGRFSITRPAGQKPSCLQARQAGYLIGQQSSPQEALGVITLPGGDVTGDNFIDIFDLASMAARFNTTDPQADVTGDGLVDIFDLALGAGNFDRPGPVTDWK